MCVYRCVCVCVCVYVWKSDCRCLSITPHAPLLFSLSVVFSPLSVSLLFSPPVGRWLSISQQSSVSSPSRSEQPCSGLSLVGKRVWRKITDWRTWDYVCLCVCVWERGEYYKEAGLSGRWWFFWSCTLHTSCWCCSSLGFLYSWLIKKTAWESVCMLKPAGGWVKWQRKQSKPIK